MKSSFFWTPLFFIFIVLFPSTANAQFEQKLTLQLSGGYVHSLAPESFSQSFPNGFSLDGGLQYNVNRNLGIVALAKYATFLGGISSGSTTLDLEYHQFGLSLCPKYRFLPSDNINPYVFGGLSLNFIRMTIPNFSFSSDFQLAFGTIGGVGLDVRLTDNLALFVQGGVVSNQLEEWLTSAFVQVGFNINMFKAKSL